MAETPILPYIQLTNFKKTKNTIKRVPKSREDVEKKWQFLIEKTHIFPTLFFGEIVNVLQLFSY